MNNIFYEFLEKNKLDDVIDNLPINENFNLPFVDKNALQPLRIDLVMYPIKVNNVIYNCYISSVPRPLLYFTLKKSKIVLDIATQEQILQALVSSKTLQKDRDYVVIKSPKTLAPIGKGFITGDAIAWKKGVWQFIRTAIEKGSKSNIQSKITINTPASSGSSGSNSTSNNVNTQSASSSSENQSSSKENENQNEINHIKEKLKIGGKHERYLKVYKNEKIKSFIELIEKNNLGGALENSKSFEKYAETVNGDTDGAKHIKEILSMYPEIRKILLAANYNSTKTINDFLSDYKMVSQPDKIKKIDWFYENHVNNHFTMKRIFNS